MATKWGWRGRGPYEQLSLVDCVNTSIGPCLIWLCAVWFYTTQFEQLHTGCTWHRKGLCHKFLFWPRNVSEISLFKKLNHCSLFCFSYTIMKICWNLEPTERPTFNKITQLIERLLGDQTEREQVSQCETRSMGQSMWDSTQVLKMFFFNLFYLYNRQTIWVLF